MKVRIKAGPLAGQIGQATVVYYDVQHRHPDKGPDLCYVKVGNTGQELLSTDLEIIEQPEPEDKLAGWDKNGQPVYGEQLVVWRKTILAVNWNQIEGAWQLDRVEGHYAYQTIRNLGEMQVIGSLAGLNDGDALREIERAWRAISSKS